MTYKTLLTFHALEEPLSNLEQTIELAQASSAHLDIIVLGALISPPVVVHNSAPAVEWIKHNNEVMASAEKCVTKVEKLVAEKGISASVVAECGYLGVYDNDASRYAYCADVCVLNKQALEMKDSVYRAFNKTLFEACSPLLILPEQETRFDDMSKITIAWNGKAEAAKAVHRSLPLLKRADEVHVLLVDPEDSYTGEDPGDDIAAFLARHGIKVTVNAAPSAGKSVEDKLLQMSHDIGSDLLVMGAYGHSKLREWLIGGTTKDILKKMNIPIFMVH